MFFLAVTANIAESAVLAKVTVQSPSYLLYFLQMVLSADNARDRLIAAGYVALVARFLGYTDLGHVGHVSEI